MGVYTGTPGLPALLAGDIPAASAWGALLSAMHAVVDTQSTYVPTWTATGSNPVLNNGVASGSYSQVGHLTIYSGSITMGSTTTYGSGSYLVSMPVSLSRGFGFCYLEDASASANNRVGLLSGAGVLQTSGNNVNPTNPFTFAVGDRIVWSIVYEN